MSVRRLLVLALFLLPACGDIPEPQDPHSSNKSRAEIEREAAETHAKYDGAHAKAKAEVDAHNAERERALWEDKTRHLAKCQRSLPRREAEYQRRMDAEPGEAPELRHGNPAALSDYEFSQMHTCKQADIDSSEVAKRYWSTRP